MLAAPGCATSSAPTAPARVFLIVMENHSFDEAMTGAFTAELAARGGVAASYHAITHPSVPNYLALTSGQTRGVHDDSYHSLPRKDLGDQLTQARIPWRAYMEGLGSAGCLASPEPYDPGHNPFAFYGGGCPANVVPFSSIGSDLASGAMRFSWITPDSCHDQHSCPISAGDDWLRQTVGEITGSHAWDPGSVLFVTWDEDEGLSDNHVLTLVIRPGGQHSVSHIRYDHYSLLRTLEDIFGVAPLANASTATPMRDLTGI